MGSEEIDKARLKALEAEAEKHLAEKEKLVRERDELDKKLSNSFLDISLSSIIKTVVAGVVAGILLWSIGLDYMFKINKVNVELKQQIEVENNNLQVEKKALKSELEKTQQKLLALDDRTSISKAEDAKKFTAAIVEEVHRLEDQSSKISVTQIAESSDNLNKQGWVYLGEYSDEVWKTRYFDFSLNLKPDQLTGRTVSVKVDSINVRTKKLSGDVIKVLVKNQKVLLNQVENYPFTNYVWANVRY